MGPRTDAMNPLDETSPAPTPDVLRALHNVRAGHGPLVRGVRLAALENMGYVERTGGVWRITKLGTDVLAANNAL